MDHMIDRSSSDQEIDRHRDPFLPACNNKGLRGNDGGLPDHEWNPEDSESGVMYLEHLNASPR